MKIQIERTPLLKALTHVHSIVERRAVIPILANVLLKSVKKSGSQQLELMTTDHDITIQETLDAAIDQEGAITVNAHTFFDIVRKLPSKNSVIIETIDANQIRVVSGPCRFQIPTLPAEDFRPLVVGDLPYTFSVDVEKLKDLLMRTRFAMSNEEARYYLNGVYLHIMKEESSCYLRAVATDGHRLALAQIEAPESAQEMPGVVIPKKTILELSRLLEDAQDEVVVSLSLTQISFEIGGSYICSRLIDGTFPDYESVIPQNSDLHVRVERETFADAVDRVSIFSFDKSRGVKMLVESGKMSISAAHQEQGEALEELEIQYKGRRLVTGFNARYLIDIAQQLQSEVITLSMLNETSPVLIKGEQDKNILYVLMPMRV